MTATGWQPYREPLRNTLLRTFAIAIVAGLLWGGLHRWPAATLLLLWPSFGGHWVEILFLNVLRPRLPASRVGQSIARVALWYLAGVTLTFAMQLIASLMTGFLLPRLPGPALGGLAFIGIELIAHLAMQLRGRPSFYNGHA